MTRLPLLLLALLLPLSAIAAAPPEAAPKSALPPVQQFKQDVVKSKQGVGLALKNARFTAGWIPRSFVTALLRYQPGLLPGVPLNEKQWRESPWFRDGNSYIPGITEWGAQWMARRADQSKAMKQLNWDYSGSASVGIGRFLGFAFDPTLIALLLGSVSAVRGFYLRRQQRRIELERMRADHAQRGQYPLFPPAPFTDQPDTGTAQHLPEAPIDTDADHRHNQIPTFSADSAADTPPPPRAPAPPSAEEQAFTAFQACQSKAEAGSSEAQFQLGTLFSRGVGVEASKQQAHHWFQQAAEQSHPQAQYELARMLFHGIGVLPDEHAAALWMEQAARQGLTDAKFNLATLYARGIGVSTDPANALYWLRQAADEHDADAAELMACAFENGWLGLAQDAGQAASWRNTATASRQ